MGSEDDAKEASRVRYVSRSSGCHDQGGGEGTERSRGSEWIKNGTEKEVGTSQCRRRGAGSSRVLCRRFETKTLPAGEGPAPEAKSWPLAEPLLLASSPSFGADAWPLFTEFVGKDDDIGPTIGPRHTRK